MMSNANNSNQHRLKRLEKDFKNHRIGKKQTALGTLLYISIESSKIWELTKVPLDQKIDSYNFEILLKEKFPF